MRYLWLRSGESGTVLSENKKWTAANRDKNPTRNWNKWQGTKSSSRKLIQLKEDSWEHIYDEGTPLDIAFRAKHKNKVYYGIKNHSFLASSNLKALKKIVNNELKRLYYRMKKKEKHWFLIDGWDVNKRTNLILFLKKTERW